VGENTCHITKFSRSNGSNFGIKRAAKYPAIFKRGYEDVHRHIQPGYTDQGPDNESEARRLEGSGFVRNFSCYMYATEDIPVFDNLPYLQWAYYDTLSPLVRILIAKGEGRRAKPQNRVSGCGKFLKTSIDLVSSTSSRSATQLSAYLALATKKALSGLVWAIYGAC
jgi:hypothetical protein